jgi:hypothetical protein
VGGYAGRPRPSTCPCSCMSCAAAMRSAPSRPNPHQERTTNQSRMTHARSKRSAKKNLRRSGGSPQDSLLWFGTPPPPAVLRVRVGRTILGGIASPTLAHKSSILLQVLHELCGFEPSGLPAGTSHMWYGRRAVDADVMSWSAWGLRCIRRPGLYSPSCFSAGSRGGVRPRSGVGRASTRFQSWCRGGAVCRPRCRDGPLCAAICRLLDRK